MADRKKPFTNMRLSSYEKLAKFHPIYHKRFVPGVIGENITATDMHDHSVCIGDIYQMGDIKVQVSSPRIPCWKISHKIEVDGLDKFVEKHQITGWYYRVLGEGTLNVGDSIELIERPNPQLSIQTFMKIVTRVIDEQEVIKSASLAEGLDPEWRKRLEQRLIVNGSDGATNPEYSL